MNIEFNSNFYEALSKLDKVYGSKEFTPSTDLHNYVFTEELIEDTDTGDAQIEIPDSVKNDLGIIVNLIQSKAARDSALTLSRERSENLINKAIAAGSQFGKAGVQSTWPYQLQLLCNAYISEQAILKALKEPKSKLAREILAIYHGQVILQNYLL